MDKGFVLSHNSVIIVFLFFVFLFFLIKKSTGLTANPAVSLIGVRSCLKLSGLLSSFGFIVCTVATNEITLLFGLLFVGENECLF